MATPIDWATPAPFVNAKSDRIDTDGQDGMACELKTYEVHFDTKGERITLQADTKRRAQNPEERDHDSALVLKRHYDKDKVLESTELVVRSPHLKLALREVIGTYPGMTLDSNDIIIYDKPKCLFHYRSELKEYGLSTQDPMAVQHLTFLLTYMYTALEKEMRHYYSYIESPSVTPGLEFDYLWMAFRPGDLVYVRIFPSPDYTFRVRKMDKRGDGWEVEGVKLFFNGDAYCPYVVKERIEAYDGYQPFEKLGIFPLKYHPQKEEVERRMIETGQKAVRLHGTHHCFYSGPSYFFKAVEENPGSKGGLKLVHMPIYSRVIVDIRGFNITFPNIKRNFVESEVIKTTPGVTPHLSDEELMIFSNTTECFSLSNKIWVNVLVAKLEEVRYAAHSFDRLLIPAHSKDMIVAIVNAQSEQSTFLGIRTADDNGGGGTIILLHGENGVGKTLTAESIADLTRRPLYTLSGGDLGVDIASAEKNLEQALNLASHWKAILLINEADMFLERRRSQGMKRNALVSVFLRMMEKYNGIMVLTTTCIEAIDPAVRSRVHVAIRYQYPDFGCRLRLWKDFLDDELRRYRRGIWLSEVDLHALATEELSGRQIKNIVHTAKMIARGKRRLIERADIKLALDTLKDSGSELRHESRSLAGNKRVQAATVGDHDRRSIKRAKGTDMVSTPEVLDLVSSDEEEEDDDEDDDDRYD